MDLEDLRKTKHFYRNNLRLALTMTFFSTLLTGILVVFVFYLMVFKKEPMYYATNSAGFITPLNSMSKPNNSPNALLPPDPPEEINQKTVDFENKSSAETGESSQTQPASPTSPAPVVPGAPASVPAPAAQTPTLPLSQ